MTEGLFPREPAPCTMPLVLPAPCCFPEPFAAGGMNGLRATASCNAWPPPRLENRAPVSVSPEELAWELTSRCWQTGDLKVVPSSVVWTGPVRGTIEAANHLQEGEAGET